MTSDATTPPVVEKPPLRMTDELLDGYLKRVDWEKVNAAPDPVMETFRQLGDFIDEEP